MHLVFASGFLQPQKVLGIDYFRGLPAEYPDALFPKVAINGRVRDRAPVLAQQIRDRFPEGDIHIIAHSMGGLDSRFLLSKNLLGLAQRVRSLSTVSTPHRGSPVADLILGLIPGIDAGQGSGILGPNRAFVQPFRFRRELQKRGGLPGHVQHGPPSYAGSHSARFVRHGSSATRLRQAATPKRSM